MTETLQQQLIDLSNLFKIWFIKEAEFIQKWDIITDKIRFIKENIRNMEKYVEKHTPQQQIAV